MKQKFFFLLFLSLYIVNCTFYIEAQATIRFVSKSGTSTPPYTSWQTASDSIQKCINICVDSDTIYVANGIYYECLIVNKYLWLIGSSMDSTVIDGTGLAGTTVYAQADLNIENFNIIGKENTTSTNVIYISDYNGSISGCRLTNARTGLFLGISSGNVSNLIINNCGLGVVSFCYSDTCHPVISNSIIIMDGGSGFPTAIKIFDGGNPKIVDNVLIGDLQATNGIGISYSAKDITIKNNIVTGFTVSNISSSGTTDSAIIENNVSAYLPENNFGWAGIETNQNTHLRNNIIANNNIGVTGNVSIYSKYNLFWKNITNTGGGVEVDSTDVLENPMFVNDTIPTYGGTYDYHLQMFSPAINSGDPNILDVDGTRSDIGAYGGPGGEKYTYIDLPPRPPVNLSAEIDTVSSIVILTWNRNSEADTAYYNVYRDSTINFPVDSSKLISSQADTVFLDVIPPGYRTVVYKVTAVDQQGNESQPSEEQVISIVGIEKEPVVVNNYILYQNYPNPFNPSTKIGYKLIGRGYVKLMVYDIKGELVTVLVNEVKEAGYYEVEFNFGAKGERQEVIRHLSSGIYLYRIEVIGEGNIPRFSDIKKMILLK